MGHLSLWDGDQMPDHCIVAGSTELCTFNQIRARLVCSNPTVIHMSWNGVDVDAQLRNEEAVSDIERDYLKVDHFAHFDIELVLQSQTVRIASARSVRKGHSAPIIVLKRPIELSSNHCDMC